MERQKDFTQHDWTGRNVLLFGSEGYGLRKKTLDKSDFCSRSISTKTWKV